ncbi:MAG: polyprenyl synthetase family protein [Bacteroidaceae bacterium]
MDQLSKIKLPIQADLDKFCTLFNQSLSSSNPLLTEVFKHIRHSEGKMMRPIIFLLMTRMYGEVKVESLHAAVSLELLHTASLIHDDVVDESDERRGQPSINDIFNNKVSVLSGDYLLASSLLHSVYTNDIRIVKIISQLGQNLSEGELLQLSNISNKEINESVYFDVIKKKTAAFFSACTMAGALSLKVNDKQLEVARLLGQYIGICFQIKDDIFDYYNNTNIGKPTGNDMIEGKLTLPAIYALRTSVDEKAENYAAKVKSRTATAEEIEFLVNFTKRSGGIEYASQVMKDYHDKALSLILSFPQSEVRSSLEMYADFVVNRVK